MAYPIHEKLVIAVASSALFDLTESQAVYENEGEDAYRDYQRKYLHTTFEKGVAFPFIRRFLNINSVYPEEQPVEVMLLSHNDPETGLRIFNSIKDYELPITRGAFLTGKSPHSYIPAFNVSLFLSAKADDVRRAIEAHYPAGTVIPSDVKDEASDHELRIAFDFDGVIADDEAESAYAKGNIELFQQHETEYVAIPHKPGPLSDLFKKLSKFQQLEKNHAKIDGNFQRMLRISIITARNAPAHERVVTTLIDMGVRPDETFFLGGIEKNRVLTVLKPHIFFDDQMTHLQSVAGSIPSVHVPFGVRNNERNLEMKDEDNSHGE